MRDRPAEAPEGRASFPGPALPAPPARQEDAWESGSAVAVVAGVVSPELVCSLESLVSGTEGLVFRGSAPTTDRLLACCMEAGDCIALVDPALGPHGLRAFMQLLRMMAAGVRVVLISDMQSPHMLREAIRWGASGFVEKAAPPAEIRAALLAAAGSQRYLSPRMAEDLADSSFVLRELTPRESRVLAVLTHGDCNKLISSLHPNWR